MATTLLSPPEGWVDLLADWIGPSISPEEVMRSLEQQSWEDLERFLAPREEVPAGKHVVDARLLGTSTGYRLWVLFE